MMPPRQKREECKRRPFPLAGFPTKLLSVPFLRRQRTSAEAKKAENRACYGGRGMINHSQVELFLWLLFILFPNLDWFSTFSFCLPESLLSNLL